MAVAEKKERFLAEIAQRDCVAAGKLVFFGKRGEERFGEQGQGFKFVAANGERENGEIDRAGTEAVEKDGSNFFDYGDGGIGKSSGECGEDGRQEIRRDRGDDTDGDVAGDGILALGDVAAGGFEFAEDGAGARQKSFAGVGEADGAAETVKKADAEFGFEFQDLLGQRGLRDVGMFGGAREAAGVGYRAEVTELVEFHRAVNSSQSTVHSSKQSQDSAETVLSVPIPSL